MSLSAILWNLNAINETLMRSYQLDILLHNWKYVHIILKKIFYNRFTKAIQVSLSIHLLKIS